MLKIITIVVIILSILVLLYNYKRYKTISIKYQSLKNEIDTKYIKNDAKVQNAACLAYEWAKEHNDTFEEHVFHDLLIELKRKQ